MATQSNVNWDGGLEGTRGGIWGASRFWVELGGRWGLQGIGGASGACREDRGG